MAHTVVGLFSTFAEAQQVKQNLIGQGYSSSNIQIVANDEDAAGYSATDRTSQTLSTTDAGSALDEDYRDKATDYSVGSDRTNSRYDAEQTTEGEGIGDRIKNFFSSLTGGDEHAHEHYARGLNQGGALLTVRAAEQAEATEIAAMLRQHGARDIELDGNTSGRGTYADTETNQFAGRNNIDGQTSIPVVEEQLEVGKRTVERGGVRVYSHIVETPVDQDVTLRDERINVERRPVNRQATAADFESAKRGPVDLTAHGEEAVISKTARVIEEVVVGKESTSRTESIHDSVRKTEVEVEQLAGNTARDYDKDRNRS